MNGYDAMDSDVGLGLKKRVIIVDDIRTDLHYIGKLVSGFGHETILSDSASSALELVDGMTDLIIVDGLMPELDGFGFVKSIRGNPDISHIPVIMVTSLSGRSDRIRAVEVGINDFITKPVDKVELKVRVDSMLKMKEAQDGVRRYQQELERLVERKTWALNLTLQKLQAVLNGMSDCMVTVDRDLLITELNNSFEAMCGKQAGELKGTPFFQLLMGGHQIEAFTDLFTRLSGAGERDVEFSQWGRRIFSVQATPMKEGGHIVMMRDITEKKQADEQRARFLSILSHELRTPLNGIKGFSELMMTEPAAFTREHREYLKHIHSCGCQLESIVEEILRFVEFYDNPVEPDDTDIRLDDVAADVLGSLSDKYGDKEIRVSQTIEGEIPVVHGKNEHFSEIFKQIMDNAMKFSPDHGKVDIVFRTSGDGVRFICRDNGRGIPENALARVFESFFQVEDYNTRTMDGLGLGLTICRKIVELYNGRIDIASRLGEWTEVTVLIPFPVNGLHH